MGQTPPFTTNDIYTVQPPVIFSSRSGRYYTEERMQKVIHHSREIRVIQSRPIRLSQLTTNVEFGIQVYVRVIIGRDQKLDRSGPRALWASISPQSYWLRQTVLV